MLHVAFSPPAAAARWCMRSFRNRRHPVHLVLGLAPELGGVVSLGCREAVDVDRLVLVVSHVGCVDLSKTIK